MVEQAIARDYVLQAVAKRVAGDIVFSDNIAASLKKWREYFEVSQSEIARAMNVAPSVISDYEKGRRVPGAKFIQRFVTALLEIDGRRGWKKVTALTASLGIMPEVIIDMREFEKPVRLEEFITAVKGVLLNPEARADRLIYGYTVVDSIKAILSLSGLQFSILFGLTPERAFIFTRVAMGRSPMVAVRVTPIKPSIVVLHGPRERVDPLAVELARREGIPLILSLARSEDELLSELRKLASHVTPLG
ncbi:MAG: helix-turn-helix domain-containing protein [Acidilobaceae archaeon]